MILKFFFNLWPHTFSELYPAPLHLRFVATYDGLYPLRLSQACDICDRYLEVIVKEGLNNRFFRHQTCYSLLPAKPGGQADLVISLCKYKVVGPTL
jgi:hypothetical protein